MARFDALTASCLLSPCAGGDKGELGGPVQTTMCYHAVAGSYTIDTAQRPLGQARCEGTCRWYTPVIVRLCNVNCLQVSPADDSPPLSVWSPALPRAHGSPNTAGCTQPQSDTYESLHSMACACSAFQGCCTGYDLCELCCDGRLPRPACGAYCQSQHPEHRKPADQLCKQSAPVVRERELLEHLRCVLRGALHGRHARGLLAAVVLCHGIVNDLHMHRAQRSAAHSVHEALVTSKWGLAEDPCACLLCCWQSTRTSQLVHSLS